LESSIWVTLGPQTYILHLVTNSTYVEEFEVQSMNFLTRSESLN
jgi:hypothetical protein